MSTELRLCERLDHDILMPLCSKTVSALRERVNRFPSKKKLPVKRFDRKFGLN